MQGVPCDACAAEGAFKGTMHSLTPPLSLPLIEPLSPLPITLPAPSLGQKIRAPVERHGHDCEAIELIVLIEKNAGIGEMRGVVRGCE